MLKGTNVQGQSVHKMEHIALGDLMAMLGMGQNPQPNHRMRTPPIQRENPHRSAKKRLEFDRQYIHSVYEQMVGLDPFHLNRTNERVDGVKTTIIEPLDGKTRLMALCSYYDNVYGLASKMSSDGQIVFYSDILPSPTWPSRIMTPEEQDWLDSREIPVIWYKDLPRPIQTKVFISLNRFKSPVTIPEMLNAVSLGSDTSVTDDFSAACSKVESELKHIVSAKVFRDRQMVVAVCTCLGLWATGNVSSPLRSEAVLDVLVVKNETGDSGWMDEITQRLPFMVAAVKILYRASTSKPGPLLVDGSGASSTPLHIPLGRGKDGTPRQTRLIEELAFYAVSHAVLIRNIPSHEINEDLRSLTALHFQRGSEWSTLLDASISAEDTIERASHALIPCQDM